MNLQQKQQYFHATNELPSISELPAIELPTISELPAIVGSDDTNVDNTSDGQDVFFTDDPKFVADSNTNIDIKPVRVKK